MLAGFVKFFHSPDANGGGAPTMFFGLIGK